MLVYAVEMFFQATNIGSFGRTISIRLQQSKQLTIQHRVQHGFQNF